MLTLKLNTHATILKLIGNTLRVLFKGMRQVFHHELLSIYFITHLCEYQLGVNSLTVKLNCVRAPALLSLSMVFR